MIVQPKFNETLQGEEALQMKYEDTDRMLDRYRLYDHENLKNKTARTGKVMHWKDLVRYVIKQNPLIWAETSNNDENVMGFYREFKGEKQYLNASFEKIGLPEWSYALVDNADLPYKEVRGWKTVLLRLLAIGALTETQVDNIAKKYGTEDSDQNYRWRQFKFKMRNRR